MRLGLILLLLLLVSCAETPSKPTTSGGASSGSGKVVTATPEEPYECDSDLILEPHLPEECIPPEPPEPVVQKPVEPPKPDPIVGTYKQFRALGDIYIFRIYPDGSFAYSGTDADPNDTWKREDDVYRFYTPNYNDVITNWFCVTFQRIEGEPDLVMSEADGCKNYVKFEALKVSDDPSYLFDFYSIQCRWNSYAKCFAYDAEKKKILGGSGPGWHCRNVGRTGRDSRRFMGLYNSKKYSRSPSAHADSLEECEANCEGALMNRFGEVGEGNCSDYKP